MSQKIQLERFTNELFELLDETFEHVHGNYLDKGTWEGEGDISGSLAILVHSAYHLGEIRQILGAVK